MEYLTVDGAATAEYEIQHSLFIGNVKGIASFDEGMAFVREISKKYSDATHNCYAVIARDGQQKFSDDGEPQGTAGMPILQVLKKNSLTDVVAVVTRYFGGIKLGAGGLVASYTKSCVDALAAAKITTVKLCDVTEIILGYSDYKRAANIVSEGKILNIEYSDGVKATVATPVEQTEGMIKKLLEATAGKLNYKKTTQEYLKF